jgi:hypothetical protein
MLRQFLETPGYSDIQLEEAKAWNLVVDCEKQKGGHWAALLFSDNKSSLVRER